MSASKQKVIWITGASSGLGRSTALMLARQGNLVIASARSSDALDELAAEHSNIAPLVCDITDEKSVAKAVKKIGESSTGLDQVILNAGNCEYLDFPDPDWGAVERVMTVNFFGTVNCVEHALPQHRQRRIH